MFKKSHFILTIVMLVVTRTVHSQQPDQNSQKPSPFKRLFSICKSFFGCKTTSTPIEKPEKKEVNVENIRTRLLFIINQIDQKYDEALQEFYDALGDNEQKSSETPEDNDSVPKKDTLSLIRDAINNATETDRITTIKDLFIENVIKKIGLAESSVTKITTYLTSTENDTSQNQEIITSLIQQQLTQQSLENNTGTEENTGPNHVPHKFSQHLNSNLQRYNQNPRPQLPHSPPIRRTPLGFHNQTSLRDCDPHEIPFIHDNYLDTDDDPSEGYSAEPYLRNCSRQPQQTYFQSNIPTFTSDNLANHGSHIDSNSSSHHQASFLLPLLPTPASPASAPARTTIGDLTEPSTIKEHLITMITALQDDRVISDKDITTSWFYSFKNSKNKNNTIETFIARIQQESTINAEFVEHFIIQWYNLALNKKQNNNKKDASTIAIALKDLIGFIKTHTSLTIKLDAIEKSINDMASEEPIISMIEEVKASKISITDFLEWMNLYGPPITSLNKTSQNNINAITTLDIIKDEVENLLIDLNMNQIESLIKTKTKIKLKNFLQTNLRIHKSKQLNKDTIRGLQEKINSIINSYYKKALNLKDADLQKAKNLATTLKNFIDLVTFYGPDTLSLTEERILQDIDSIINSTAPVAHTTPTSNLPNNATSLSRKTPAAVASKSE